MTLGHYPLVLPLVLRVNRLASRFTVGLKLMLKCIEKAENTEPKDTSDALQLEFGRLIDFSISTDSILKAIIDQAQRLVSV